MKGSKTWRLELGGEGEWGEEGECPLGSFSLRLLARPLRCCSVGRCPRAQPSAHHPERSVQAAAGWGWGLSLRQPEVVPHFRDERLCSSHGVGCKEEKPDRLVNVTKGTWAHASESSGVAAFSPQPEGQRPPLPAVLAPSPDRLWCVHPSSSGLTLSGSIQRERFLLSQRPRRRPGLRGAARSSPGQQQTSPSLGWLSPY